MVACLHVQFFMLQYPGVELDIKRLVLRGILHPSPFKPPTHPRTHRGGTQASASLFIRVPCQSSLSLTSAYTSHQAPDNRARAHGLCSHPHPRPKHATTNQQTSLQRQHRARVLTRDIGPAIAAHARLPVATVTRSRAPCTCARHLGPGRRPPLPVYVRPAGMCSRQAGMGAAQGTIVAFEGRDRGRRMRRWAGGAVGRRAVVSDPDTAENDRNRRPRLRGCVGPRPHGNPGPGTCVMAGGHVGATSGTGWGRCLPGGFERVLGRPRQGQYRRWRACSLMADVG